MKIRKINNDKLKVILNSRDLNDKNIDIDSFLSNSIESQDLFFEILDLAEEEYDFSIENNKAIVETISLDNNLFVLTITKLTNNSMCNLDSVIHMYCFENIDNFLNFCSYMKKYNIPKDTYYLYKLKDKYYFILNKDNSFLKNILPEYSLPIKNSKYLEDILLEYGQKIN